MAVDIDDKKLDGKGLSDLWGIIKQYVAQHSSDVVPATEDTLGGIMVGSTLSITSAGVLNLPTLVTASTFRSVSVDAYGRVVGGTNPTTLAAYGITDAKIENGVITLGGNTIKPITSLSGYATQSWVQQQGYTTNIGTVTQVKIGSTAYNPTSGVVSLPSYPTVPTKVSELTNDSGYTTNIGTVTQVKVGSTAYNPSSGVVSLPAYPTSLPASDVSAWAKASSKPSYTLDEVSDGSSRKLSNYFPKSGGTLSSSGREMLIMNQTVDSSVENQGAYIRFQNNGVNLGGVGYNTSLGTFLEFVGAGGRYYSLILNGTSITYNGWDLITSNNIGSQSVNYATTAGSATDSTKVAKSGDTMTGKLIVSTASYPLELRTSGTESSLQFCPSGTTGNGRYVMGCYDGTTSEKSAFFLWDSTLGTQTFHIENGRCSINNGSAYPSYNLEVNGSLRATTYYNLPFSVAHGTMYSGTASGSHYYYLPMSVSDARKCIFTYIMHNAYQYQSGCYSCHAGNGLADTMGVKYVTSDTYNGTTITNSWLVTTGGFDAGNVYYNYILIN